MVYTTSSAEIVAVAAAAAAAAAAAPPPPQSQPPPPPPVGSIYLYYLGDPQIQLNLADRQCKQARNPNRKKILASSRY